MSFRFPHDIRFKCLRCAACCGDTSLHVRHILMLKQETQRIAKTTSKPVKEFATKIEAHEPYAYEMKKTPDGGRCVFLKDNLCTIYEYRPVICRFYPFELKPVSFGTGEFLPTDECPGIGKGARALEKDYFEVLVRYLKEMLEGSKSDSVFGWFIVRLGF